MEEEDWFDITKIMLLEYREFLNLKKGILKRFYRIKDPQSRIFVINSLRFLSQHNPHLGGIRYSIYSENWTGKITIRSSILGDVTNSGVPRYKELTNQHFEVINKGVYHQEYLYLQMKTLQSQWEISEVVKTEVYKKNLKIIEPSRIVEEIKNIHAEFDLILQPYEKIAVTKILSLHHSKDWGISENLYDALKLLHSNPCFKTLLRHHILAWKVIGLLIMI